MATIKSTASEITFTATLNLKEMQILTTLLGKCTGKVDKRLGIDSSVYLFGEFKDALEEAGHDYPSTRIVIKET